MDKKVFLDVNDIGVLHVIAKGGQGIVPFQVIDKMVRPFEYGRLGVQIAPAGDSGTVRLKGTFAGVTLNDMFEYDDVDYLLHIVLESYPSMRIYPSWISGYLQSDYHDLLPGTKGEAFGFVWPPVEVMSVPKVHLDWVFYNQYGSETIDPYIRFLYGAYNIKYLTDTDLIMDILAKRHRPEPKWFTIYGRKTFDYNFKDNMKISRPIPITASRDEIESILSEWRRLGLWT